MSFPFGVGVGDIITVGELCWKIYKRVKDSPGNYKELASEVSGLYTVIKETQELLSQQDISEKQQAQLKPCEQGCRTVLKDLEDLLGKYESLGTKSQRTFDRMNFGFQDINSIRLRLISNVSMLDAFNNASSHARLERKLNLLITEVRTGQREGSVVSIETFNSTAHRNQETWDALRRELEDIGILPNVINEKRHFIVAWFQEAVAAGQFERDVPTDKADDQAYDSDSFTILDQFQHDELASSIAKVESRSKQLPSHKYNFKTRGRPMSRFQISHPLERYQTAEQRLLDAVWCNDLPKVIAILKTGADISVKYEDGMSLLHKAIINADFAIFRTLLLNGADVEAKRPDTENNMLVSAVLENRLWAVDLLLQNGADINSTTSSKGWTALIAAARYGWTHTVQLLLEKGARTEIRSEYPDGDTALMKAARFGHLETVQLLCKNGANIYEVDFEIMNQQPR